MKRNICYIGCVLAGTLLTSCSNDDEPLAYGEYPLKIESATVIADGAASRVAENADGTGSQWTDGDKISVRIGDDGKIGTYTLNADGSVKTADAPVYWQSRAAQTVTAWYPATDGAIDLSDQTAGLKYVLKATAKDKTYSDAVSLVFKHQLAKVRVKLSGDKAADVTAVAVKGMTSFSTEQGTVGEAINEGYINMMRSTYTDGECYEANLVPQAISADDFVQITADGKTYICKMDCDVTDIEAGNAYTFNVRITTDGDAYVDTSTHTIYTAQEGQITTDLVSSAMDGTGTLKISGPISQEDFNVILAALENVDDFVELDMSYIEYLSIPDEAFTSILIKSISLSDAVAVTIGEKAFCNCQALESVTFPKGRGEINSHAFEGCSKLTSIIIPERTTKIGSNAFNGCSGLTSIYIPESVSYIGGAAFKNCTGLKSINIPKNEQILLEEEKLTSIYMYTFYGCSSLTSINIPESVTSIAWGAFYGCSSLTSINIPKGITSIEPNTFFRCSNLSTLECRAIYPPTGDISDVPSSCTIKVPAKSLDLYKEADGWKDFTNIEALDE